MNQGNLLAMPQIEALAWLQGMMWCGHPQACLGCLTDDDGETYEGCTACEQQAKAVKAAEARCHEIAEQGAYVVEAGATLRVVGKGSVGYLFVYGSCYFERPHADPLAATLAGLEPEPADEPVRFDAVPAPADAPPPAPREE